MQIGVKVTEKRSPLSLRTMLGQICTVHEDDCQRSPLSLHISKIITYPSTSVYSGTFVYSNRVDKHQVGLPKANKHRRVQFAFVYVVAPL